MELFWIAKEMIWISVVITADLSPIRWIPSILVSPVWEWSGLLFSLTWACECLDYYWGTSAEKDRILLHDVDSALTIGQASPGILLPSWSFFLYLIPISYDCKSRSMVIIFVYFISSSVGITFFHFFSVYHEKLHCHISIPIPNS